MGETLSVLQVAERLQVHPTSIQRWIRGGNFPNAYKKGLGKTSPYLIPKKDVAAFEEARRQQATAQK